MSLNAASIDKESGLEVRIGPKKEGAVAWTAMLFPGMSMLSGTKHIAGTTQVIGQEKVDRDAIKKVWTPLLAGVPKGLPAGDEFALTARVGGKTVVEINTTLAAAKADKTLSATVDAVQGLGKQAFADLATEAGEIWAR